MGFKRWSQDIYVALALLAAGTYLLINAVTKMSKDAAQFPILILIVFMLLSAALLVKGIKDSRDSASQNETLKNQIHFSEVKMPMAAFLLITIYVVCVDKIGFIAPSLVFAAGMMWFNYVRNKLVCVLVPVGLVGFLYVLFTFILSSRLP